MVYYKLPDQNRTFSTDVQGAATVLRGEELLLLSKKTFSFRFSTFDESEVSTFDAKSRKDTFDQI